MLFATTRLSLILFGLSLMLKYKARRHEAFWKRIKERNFVAQIMTRDEEIGRWFEFRDGTIRSGAGLHAKPDCKLMFKNAAVGASLLMPPINWLDQINAQKRFERVVIDRHDDELRRRHAITKEQERVDRARLPSGQRTDLGGAGDREAHGNAEEERSSDTPGGTRRHGRAAGTARPRGTREWRPGRRCRGLGAVQSRSGGPRSRRTGRMPSRSSIRLTACSIR